MMASFLSQIALIFTFVYIFYIAHMKASSSSGIAALETLSVFLLEMRVLSTAFR